MANYKKSDIDETEEQEIPITTKSKSKNSNSSTSHRSGLNQFKYEIANELGIDLQEGDNGHLSTQEAGSIGGEMVKRMIANQTEKARKS